MKKTTLTIIAALTMSTGAMANSYPADGPDSYQNSVENKSTASDVQGAYLGAGYSYTNVDTDVTYTNGKAASDSDSFSSLTLIAGYNFNEYIGIEGRYSHTYVDNTYNTNPWYGGYVSNPDISYYGLYLKPMIPIDQFNLYGLIGYGETSIKDDEETGFQWGIGASYYFNNRSSLFVDYTRVYDEEGNFPTAKVTQVIDAITFGLVYSF